MLPSLHLFGSISTAAREYPLRQNNKMIVVGQDAGDFVGKTNQAIQDAVNHVAEGGGGIVFVKKGEYTIKDQIKLEDNVTLIGEGSATVLKKCDGFQTSLTENALTGTTQITVKNASKFDVGVGVSIADNEHRGGGAENVRTIVAINDNTLSIDTPLETDYLASKRGFVHNNFPIIAAYEKQHVRVENITVDGNKEANVFLDGCRGGGIYFSQCQNCSIISCLARNYNGDGISIQGGKAIRVEGCDVFENADFGLHVGTGVTHCIMRGNITHNNKTEGIYFCHNAQYSICSENIIYENGRYGISIGHKDKYNIIANNSIVGNGLDGIYFRDETKKYAAHYNNIIGNIICDNGQQKKADGIAVEGVTQHLLITGNLITDTRESKKTQRYGIRIGRKAGDVTVENNKLSGNRDGTVCDYR